MENNKELARELLLECNKAYDRGGVDVLKLLKETTQNIVEANPNYKEHAIFTLYVVEAVRQSLEETVNKQVHDVVKEPSKIIAY